MMPLEPTEHFEYGLFSLYWTGTDSVWIHQSESAPEHGLVGSLIAAKNQLGREGWLIDSRPTEGRTNDRHILKILNTHYPPSNGATLQSVGFTSYFTVRRLL
jgi:hypothetical protein